MGKIWTLQNRYQAWLRVELAVCEAWAELGVIDAQSMAKLRELENCRLDADRILEIEKTTRHDVIAFLTALEELAGQSARFIHLGCTSSDIVDTANALLFMQAGDLIRAGFARLIACLKKLALEHKGCLCMGRTHGVHAEPTTFALKIAGFYAEFARHAARFEKALEEVRVGKLSGATGTYAFLSPQVETLTMDRLGLKPETVSTQIIPRDRHAAFFNCLAVAAGGIERLCVELRHLQRTELREVEEGVAEGQKGSSAMPHKKNPISAENLTGLARLLRAYAIAAMENQVLWHERDISHSSVERVIMPDAAILMDYSLNRLSALMENLRVFPENMRRSMRASYGLHFSQRVLTALIENGLPRQEAYSLVQKCAMQSWESETYFPDLIMAEERILRHLPGEITARLFDDSFYLQHEQEILDRVFGKNR
jgi:adenylosuccinate lyase